MADVSNGARLGTAPNIHTDREDNGDGMTRNDDRIAKSKCIACGLPIGTKSDFLQLDEDRFAHPGCVKPPTGGQSVIRTNTVRGAAEVLARGQGGPI